MNNGIKYIKSVVAIALSILVVVGCSDDSNNSAFKAPTIPDSPVVISSDNEKQVIQSGFSASNGSNFGGIPFGAEVSGYSLSAPSPNTKNRIASVAGQLIQSVKTVNASSLNVENIPVGVSFDDEVEPCLFSGSSTASGSITTIDRVTGDFTAEPGDNLVIRYNSCEDFPGEIQNGVMKIVFNKTFTTIGLDTAMSFSMDVTSIFDNFRSTTTADNITTILHGDVNMDISMSMDMSGFESGVLSMSGESLYVLDNTDEMKMTDFSFIVNFNSTEETVNANYTVASTSLQGSLTVAMNFTFNAGAFTPIAGNLNITGDNSSINVDVDSADSSMVIVSLFINDQIVDSYPKTISWSELQVELDSFQSSLRL